MTTAPPAVPLADTQLDRVIGLKGATLLVVGAVIGSGIFLTTGAMLRRCRPRR